MKRNMDLWRRILIDIEENEIPGQRYRGPQFSDVDDAILSEHCALLVDAGLIDGHVSRSLDGAAHAQVLRLSNQGHDFLADIRSNTVWEKTKEKARSAGVSLSIEIMKSLATSVAKAHLGL